MKESPVPAPPSRPGSSRTETTGGKAKFLRKRPSERIAPPLLHPPGGKKDASPSLSPGMLSRYPEKALCTERTSAFQHGPDEIAGDAHHLVPALPVRQGQMPAVTADRAQHMGLGPAGRRADPLHGIAARAAAVMPELDITDRDIAGGQQGPQPGLLMGYLGHMAPADHPLVSLPGCGLPRGLAARGTDLHRLSPGFVISARAIIS